MELRYKFRGGRADVIEAIASLADLPEGMIARAIVVSHSEPEQWSLYVETGESPDEDRIRQILKKGARSKQPREDFFIPFRINRVSKGQPAKVRAELLADRS